MLSYLDIGTGEPVLMLHGLGQHSGAWKAQHPLAEHYRLIIPTLRGHGNSTINENITLETMAQDILELLHKLQITKVNICGLSLGGLIAQEIYRQKAEIVSSLVLCNTTFYIPSFFANKLVRNAEKFLIENDKQELIKHIAENSLYNQEFLQEAIESFQINDSYIECARSGIGFNYVPTLLRVNVPTLLIGGSHDSTTPLFNLFTMKWLIPRAKVKVLESGHLSNIEKADEWNESLLSFLNEHT